MLKKNELKEKSQVWILCFLSQRTYPTPCINVRKMARLAGFEPATLGLEVINSELPKLLEDTLTSWNFNNFRL